MAFKKGSSGNPNGRKKGQPTRTTQKAKELILLAIDQQSQSFGEVMLQLRYDEPKVWAALMVKLFDFVLPKHLDIKSDGEQLQAPIIQILPPEKQETE